MTETETMEQQRQAVDVRILESWEMEECTCIFSTPMKFIFPGESRLRCFECMRSYIARRQAAGAEESGEQASPAGASSSLVVDSSPASPARRLQRPPSPPSLTQGRTPTERVWNTHTHTHTHGTGVGTWSVVDVGSSGRNYSCAVGPPLNNPVTSKANAFITSTRTGVGTDLAWDSALRSVDFDPPIVPFKLFDQPINPIVPFQNKSGWPHGPP